MSADEETFLEQIAAEDSDDTRLVYADWLEERGDARAEYLRLEVSLHQMDPSVRARAVSARLRLEALSSSIDRAWRERVDRLPGLVRPPGSPRPARRRAEPGAVHVPSWARLRNPLATHSVTSDPAGERVTPPAWLILGVPLLLCALGSSGCVWVTHLACAPDEATHTVCRVDTYGLFARVRHADVRASEIVEVAVDERSARRGASLARVAIVTRSRGTIDLSGRQLLVSGFAIADAVEAAAALRQLSATPSARRDVDLWIGPPRLASAIALAISLGTWALLLRLVARTLRERFSRR